MINCPAVAIWASAGVIHIAHRTTTRGAKAMSLPDNPRISSLLHGTVKTLMNVTHSRAYSPKPKAQDIFPVSVSSQ